MSHKNSLKTVFTFIGTFIGAGFASGREIALFFGKCNIFIPILSCFICGGLAYIFMELGRLTQGEVTKYLFPKTYKAWDLLLCVSNFIIFTAMLAGSEYAIRDATGYVGGGILSGLLAATVVTQGIEKIKTANLLAVPFIILLCAVMFILNPHFQTKGTSSISSPILYATMNILSCGLLASKLSSHHTKKQSLHCAFLIAIILTALVLLVYLQINGRENEPMPLLGVAKSLHLGLVGSMLIYLAIITTMIGSLSLASANKPAFTVILLAAGYLLSIFGFETIVNTAYPAIGVLGVVLSIAAIFKLALYDTKRKHKILKLNAGDDII
ncbi:MAG: hypothetical protein PHI19_01850 [Clostridia bacterium]|nr:hypothetical protein [Clostridia bacterium]